MGELQQLPNIGRVAEKLLTQAGIDTAEKLRAAGSKQAFMHIRLLDPTACLHMLYGLEGAVRGVKDSTLPQDVKADLKAFFASL